MSAQEATKSTVKNRKIYYTYGESGRLKQKRVVEVIKHYQGDPPPQHELDAGPA